MLEELKNSDFFFLENEKTALALADGKFHGIRYRHFRANCENCGIVQNSLIFTIRTPVIDDESEFQNNFKNNERSRNVMLN